MRISVEKLEISIHALREEGDTLANNKDTFVYKFLSTPSARRATIQWVPHMIEYSISIHALREEGDAVQSGDWATAAKFLSTPSARRATILTRAQYSGQKDFYPRPPRGGRQKRTLEQLHRLCISIHALREEGDCILKSI